MTVRDPLRERSATLTEAVLGIAFVALAAAAVGLVAFAVAVVVSLVF